MDVLFAGCLVGKNADTWSSRAVSDREGIWDDLEAVMWPIHSAHDVFLQELTAILSPGGHWHFQYLATILHHGTEVDWPPGMCSHSQRVFRGLSEALNSCLEEPKISLQLIDCKDKLIANKPYHILTRAICCALSSFCKALGKLLHQAWR